MPDLPTVLNAMFSGGDMTVFQATVDAVGSGVVTIHASGGQFTDVPYMDTSNAQVGAVFPSVGDRVYVLGRRGWGMLVLGRAAPSDRESPSDNVTHEFAPAVIGDYNFATGTWTAPPTDVMAIEGYTSGKGAFYFLNLSGSLPGATIASANFLLGTGMFDTGGEAVDWAYVTLALFASTTPTPSAVPTFLPGATQSVKQVANSAQNGYVSIPLDWAAKLLSGAARGIAVLSEGFPGTVYGPGTLRLTTL
jgi:hypothetical protein